VSATAGYSGTPLAKKLGIRDGSRVLLLAAPDEIGDLLAPLPEGAQVQEAPTSLADVIILFCRNLSDYEANRPVARQWMKPNTGLWIAWPKRSSGIQTDLTENVIRDIALTEGLVDNKVCAISDIWSGLRLVIRLENR
jgi:hypothetical protein